MSMRWILAGLMTLGLLCGTTTAVRAAEKDDKEKNEVKVTKDQLPDAVKKTLDEQANGGTIGDIEKETKDGKTVYEADVTIQGKEYEVKIAEDGKLIKKEAESEKKEKEEKGEHKD